MNGVKEEKALWNLADVHAGSECTEKIGKHPDSTGTGGTYGETGTRNVQ